MYKVHDEVKDSLRKSSHTMTELSIALEINYDQLNHYLNGRRQIPEDVQDKMNKILATWDNV